MGSTGGESVRALVLHAAKDLRIETRPVQPPPEGSVQVSVRATGLCGSDLHYYNHGRNGNFVLRSPLVLGHEAAGIVTAVPESPSTPSVLKMGDRVAMEVGLPCRTCNLCARGRYNLCPKLTFRSSAKTYPHLDGTLQTTLNQPDAMCHRLPDNVTFEQGALVEPLAVTLHAINRSEMQDLGLGHLSWDRAHLFSERAPLVCSQQRYCLLPVYRTL